MSVTFKKGFSSYIWDIILYIILIFVFILTIYPFYYLVIMSVMPYDNYMKSAVHMLPNGFTLEYFIKILSKQSVLRAYGISFFVTIVGTILNLVLTSMFAYTLSKKRLKLFKFLNMGVVIPMVFNGGMIPFYLVIKQLHLINSVWAFILPFGINCFNVLLMKNFFMLLPEEIEESAKIDGAGDFLIFWRIIIPISKPVVATVALFYGTFHWNEWFWSGLLASNQKLYPLTVYLMGLISESKVAAQNGALIIQTSPVSETSAVILMIVIPVLLVYPSIQKSFNKGVVLGAVKG